MRWFEISFNPARESPSADDADTQPFDAPLSHRELTLSLEQRMRSSTG